MVAYGGLSPAGRLDDAALWDGTGWSPICTECAGIELSDATAIYDPDLGKTLIIGGFTGSSELAGTLALTDSTAEVLDSENPEVREGVGSASRVSARLLRGLSALRGERMTRAILAS